MVGDRVALGAVLGLIHGNVGTADDLARRHARSAGDRIADRDGHVELEAVDGEGLVESSARSPTPAPAAVSRTDSPDQRDGELVAADAGEHARPAAGPTGQPLGERLDQFVAAMVADRIVDRLEAVDVEIDDRELAGGAGGLIDAATRAAR